MSLFQRYKNQLRHNLSDLVLDRGSSYMDAMVGILLRDKARTPIMSDDQEVLISYCADRNVKTFERKSYLMMVRYIYLTNLSKTVEKNINRLEIKLKENLLTVNELEQKLVSKKESDSINNKIIHKMQELKNKLTNSRHAIDKLNNDKKDTLLKMGKLKEYFSKLEDEQKNFEQNSVDSLKDKKNNVLKMLEDLYVRDENNQLTGFVFFIKEAYKKSLHNKKLKLLLHDISISITEATLVLSFGELNKNNSVETVSPEWFLNDFFNSLTESEEIFSILDIDINKETSLTDSFNTFLAIIIGIHRVVSEHPDERHLKVDFARKMASLKLEMETINVF